MIGTRNSAFCPLLCAHSTNYRGSARCVFVALALARSHANRMKIIQSHSPSIRHTERRRRLSEPRLRQDRSERERRSHTRAHLFISDSSQLSLAIRHIIHSFRHSRSPRSSPYCCSFSPPPLGLVNKINRLARCSRFAAAAHQRDARAVRNFFKSNVCTRQIYPLELSVCS